MKKFNSIMYLAAIILVGFIFPNELQARVSPVLECVEDNGDGTYTAFFGYVNNEDETVNIPIGTSNFFTPGQDMGQPENFLPGRHVNVFSFVFSGSNYVWTLRTPGGSTSTATASKNSSKCMAPRATIFGDALLCEPFNETTVTIELIGTPPFDFKYRDAEGMLYEVNDYSDDQYDFQTNLITTFEMVSVSDAYKSGAVNGSATIALAPEASAALLAEALVKCPGEEVEFAIELNGTSPYAFTLIHQYEENGDIVEEVIEIEEVRDTPYKYITSEPGMYYLSRMNDANCEGDVNSSITTVIENYSTPTAILSGGGEFCASDDINLTLELEGEAPWVVSYQNPDNETVTIDDIATNNYQLEVAQAGTYQLLSVNDANCEGTVSGEANVIINEVPTATLSGGGSFCSDETKSLSIALSGEAPYEVTYQGPGNETFTLEEIETDSYTLEVSQSGTYQLLSVNDANCEGTVSGEANVIINEIPTATLSGGGNFCGDDPANLSIALTGEAPYEVTYQGPGNETATIENIQSDSYTLEVSQSGTYQLLSINDTYCEGTASGEVDVNIYELPTASISGGGDICGSVGGAQVNFNFTGNAPFSIVYTNGSENFEVNNISDNSHQLEISEVGTYTLVSVEDQFCTGNVSGEAVVNRNDIPEVTFSIDQNEICANGSSIQLSGSPAGGTFSGSGVNGNQFDPASAGAGTHTISYSYTSEFGCSATAEDDIVVNGLPTAQLSGGGIVCGNDESAEVSIALSGEAPFTFTYSDGTTENTVEDINSNTYSFTTNEAGNYSLLSVTGANGCEGNVSGSAEVEVITEEISLEILSEGPVCEGEEIILSANYNTETITWSTTGAGVINDINADEITYTPAEGETGDITFSITLSNPCESVTVEEVVTIVPLPDAEFSTSPAAKLVYLNVDFFPNTLDADEYLWEFGDGSTSTQVSPGYAYDQADNYEVTLTVEKDGCESTSSTIIVIEDERVVYVPNIFNPSAANPENQVVKVYGEGIAPTDFLFKVVNRWGGTLFETNNLDLAQTQGWDGRANNGEMQSLGTYTYIVQGEFRDGETFEKIGTVTLAK